ncbi:MAG: hypothetical protein K2I48_04250 [Muribaculaceae bacterium]|nr:hypothetical protein [Muribaculaceae bacterium]
MKTINIKSIILTLSILLAAAPAFAKSKKDIFYDSKSWTVNVFGDAEYLKNQEMRERVFEFPLSVPVQNMQPDEKVCTIMARTLTENGYGKRVVDILTKNGTSEDILRRLAIVNAQRADIELGRENLRVFSGDNLTNLIAEDYLPVLTHNYIVVDYRYRVTYTKGEKKGRTEIVTHPVLFRVDIDKEQAFDIMSCLGDPSRYARLKFKVSYCTSAQLYNDIIKDAPDMAVRGVITHRNPAQISIGSDMGLQKGDLVSVYSQRIDKKGRQYSKRISRARVCAVWPESAQINFEANTAGNRKNGDVVVRTPDNHSRLGVMATWQPHVWGAQILWDDKMGFTKSGIIHHFLMDLAFAMTDKPGETFVAQTGMYAGRSYKAPMFANLGLGYGLSKTFLGFFDVMPFFLLQGEAGFMVDRNILKEENTKTIYGLAVRAPIGVRFSANIGYPLRLVLEAGYALNFGLHEDGKSDYEVVDNSMKLMGAHRDGIFLNLGLIF